ncbi:MAG: choice-of-anchor K domain-containing protein [Candidatus Dojkabacteria bacterium]|nr:choice-of-anchor K domain-containing protein [Candidatus Dojkabacteria bacterium]
MDEVINTLQEDYAAPMEEVVIPNEEITQTPIEESSEATIEEEAIPKEELPDSTNQEEEVLAPEELPMWSYSGNIAVTNEVVELNKKYELPEDDSFSITFTRLPESPSKLSLEKITLTQEEVDATGSVTRVVYDIKTEMLDGTFEYDLTLPSNGGVKKVLYAEERSDILGGLKEVENSKEIGNEIVEVSGLDHFTIFISSDIGDTPTLTTAMVNNMPYVFVPPSTPIEVTITVETSGSGSEDDWRSSQYQIEGDSWVCVNTSNHSGDGTYTEDFDIVAPSTVGTYNLSLRAYNGDSCSGGVSPDYTMTDAITVITPSPTLVPPVLTVDPSDPVAMTSVSGIWTEIDGGSGHQGIGTNEIRWGSPAGAQKSGLRFTNSGTQSFDTGENFYLGMLTHMNWPTYSNTAADGAKLEITLNFDKPDIPNVVLDYDFEIDETLNSAGSCPIFQQSLTPCDDNVTFPNSYGNTVFTIGDIQYTLVIDGFVDSYPTGTPVEEFITEEQKDNSAFLVGYLSSVLVERPEIRLTKKTNNLDVTGAPGPNLYIGDAVEWQYIVQNSGNVILNNITVEDSDLGGINCPFDTLNPGDTMTCLANGIVQEGQYSNTANVVANHSSGSVNAQDSSWYFGIWQKGKIIVDKNTIPSNSTTEFNFLLKQDSIEIDSFKLSHTSTPKEIELSYGVYTLEEIPLSNWITESVCVSSIGDNESIDNLELDPGEIITCTFTNREKGKIIIQKETFPDGDENSFEFNPSWSENNFFLKDGETYNSDWLLPGSYSFTELSALGWDLTKTSCSDQSSISNIQISEGEIVTCLIENTKRGSISGHKYNDPDGLIETTDNRTPVKDWIIELWKDGLKIAETSTNTAGEYFFLNLIPGTYTLKEVVGVGWINLTAVEIPVVLDSGEIDSNNDFINVKYASITVYKNVDNNGDGDISDIGVDKLGVTDWTWDIDGVGNYATGYTVQNVMPGTYVISEEQKDNFHVTGLECNNGMNYGAVESQSITIASGQDLSCTFINSRNLGTLIVKKVVVNDDGGTLKAEDFSFKIDGGSPISFESDGENQFTKYAGLTYNITEVSNPGYSTKYDNCSNVLVPYNGTVTCTITNDDIAPKLTVVKKVVNDNGGNALPNDFKLTVGDNGVLSGVSNEYDSNKAYTIDETQLSGYKFVSITGDPKCPGVLGGTVTLDEGDDITCTITNDDIAPKLRLVKNVVNDNGGNALPNDFKLTVGGNGVLSGVSNEYDSNKAYTIDETQLSGYKFVSIAGDDKCPGVLGGTVTLDEGDDITCTITNDDIAARLTVIKDVINDTDGTKEAQDFTMSVLGTNVSQASFPGSEAGTTVTLHPGSYLVTETEDKVNYLRSDSTDCDGTIALGEHKICTISNNDIDHLPIIEVTKTANETSIPETGENVLFTFTVENKSTESVTITSLSDTIFGPLSGDADCQIGTTLPVGQSCTFVQSEFLSSDSLTVHENTFTAIAQDNEKNPATDSDTQRVSFTDVAPLIEVTKTADDNSIPETGQSVTFTFRITNTGLEDVTVTSIMDDKFGDLLPTAKAQNGGLDIVILSTNPDSYFEFTYTTTLSSDSLTTHTNRVDVIAIDDEGTSATDFDTESVRFEDVAPLIEVTKTADDTSIPETGQSVTFTFLVENIGQEDVTLNSLIDNKFGNLDGQGTCSLPQSILIGGAYSCKVSVTLESDTLTPHINTVTAKAVDDEGTEATDEDDETVNFTNVLPTIEVTKTPSVNIVAETGESVTFTYVVKNTSLKESVTITSLGDDIFGTLLGDGDCKVGTILTAGGSCEFTLDKFIEGDYSGDDHTNVFTAKAVDNEKSEATDDDDATVDFSNVVPTIEVTKKANDTSIPETGQDVTFTFTVKNTSTKESVMITSLNDSDFGSLAGDTDCEIGTILTAGSMCEFEITKWISGDYSGDDHNNIFTAKAVDNDKTEVTDSDDEDVLFEDVLPEVTVLKKASVHTVPESGGDVTYTYTVTNDSKEEVEITILEDDIFGTLLGDGDCKVGTTLLPAQSCSFSETFFIKGIAPNTHTNVFTATVEDNEGNEDTDTEDEVVTFTYVPSLKLVKEVINQYGSNSDAGDWTLYASGVTKGFSNKGDEGVFNYVDPGVAYTLTEVGEGDLDTQFEAGSWICTGGDLTGNLVGNILTLDAQDDITCTITNTALPAKLVVKKDVTVRHEGEGVYSNDMFTIDLFEYEEDGYIRDSEEDALYAEFTGLSKGSHGFIETDIPLGYSFEGCFPEGIDPRDYYEPKDTELRAAFISEYDPMEPWVYLENGETKTYVCYNEVIKPELEITKSNDKNLTGIYAGDYVTYTIVVRAPQNPENGGSYVLKDVKVVDIIPDRFKYVAGSWTGTLLEPTYETGKPAIWSLGDMTEGDEITLTYMVKVSLLQDPGIYDDIAYTYGQSILGLGEGEILGISATDDTTNFVGTQVKIIEDPEIEEGEVLGASIELPQTGAETYLTLAALISMILGIFLIAFNPKRKLGKLLIAGILLTGIFIFVQPTPANANGTLVDVRIEQPETPTNKTNFNVGYVVSTIPSEKEVTVKCLKSTDGSTFTAYDGTYTTKSGSCIVDESVITGTGSYYFKVSVTPQGGSESLSKVVKVVIDLGKPSAVTGYDKDEGVCSYTLKFKTADDGRTSKIQIFRSSNQPFTANASTMIKEMSVGPNVDVTYTDTPLPNCSTEYYYAIRSVDSFNNTSTFVTDDIVTVVIVPGTTTDTNTGADTQENGEVAGEEIDETDGTGGNGGEQEGDENGEVEGETTEDENGASTDEEENGDEEDQSFWDEYKYVIIFLGVVVLSSVGYIYVKRRK